MASFKNKKNLLQQRGEYARYFDRLRGVDFSSDHNDVEDSRFAYLVNMYRDYQSGQGGAVETIPGFRELRGGFSQFNGIHIGNGDVFFHLGTGLYRMGTVEEFEENSIALAAKDPLCYLPNKKTISFVNQGYLYILGGGSFIRVEYDSDKKPLARNVYELAYTPTTYINIDIGAQFDLNPTDFGEGREFEQRNLLNPKYKLTYIAAKGRSYFYTKERIDNDWTFESNKSDVPIFPDNLGFDVYQYGVRLPLAYNEGNGVPKVPAGYPNAIASVRPDTSASGSGTIQLADPVPLPEQNTWNPETQQFDYTQEQIDKNEVPASYQWPFAFSRGYAGIEVTVRRYIKTVGGVTNPKETIQHEIISKCTIAAAYDNRIFLSGNPDFPRHIFYCGIPEGEETPSALYFGQLNYELEGTSNAAVVAMMNVGDSLMVMKEDSDEEDSVILHTPKIQAGNDIQPVIYPSQKGHKGIGCLGPCYNFRDDPIFLSRFGVDALGHVSTKYRRAIKHRSSMIDAKLLNCYLPPLNEDEEPRKCDLKDASIAEWNGYLMILIAGRIFMADSRQMYNTESGNTEYEWYYLEDIGVYPGQFDEYVYAEFPTDLSEEKLLERTGGVELVEAKKVINEFGVTESLIGSPANSNNEEIKSVETEYGITYYRELPEYDEYSELTGRTIKYYVVPSGGKTGGAFSEAVMLKVIGKDLYFVTKNNTFCKFNFDKRDPVTGLIPNEYYDFNGRAIFSGCATKMDNCGIPHLTKTTVKRSTVIKTRTFEASGIKVKVRTNRKAFNQVARIINGQATFDDPSFEDYSFTTSDKSIFSINEREKKWVEKQIFLYSDEFHRPFAIHYLAYRYVIAGRYKE